MCTWPRAGNVVGELWWYPEGEQEAWAGLGNARLWVVGGVNGLSDQALPGHPLDLV